MEFCLWGMKLVFTCKSGIKDIVRAGKALGVDWTRIAHM